MISYLVIVYIIFIMFLIVRNNKTKNIIWLSIMLAGFCLAFFGLAFYNEYIYESVAFSSSKIFSNISKAIWIVNYYLNLDVFKAYRIMNCGVALYIIGAIGFPLSYFNNRKLKKYIMVLVAVLSLALIIIYEPKFLILILGLNKEDYITSLYNQKNLYVMNWIFNVAIKLTIVLSIGILFYDFFKVVPFLRKRFVYIFIGIAPVHVVFFVLFYWFPSHKIVISRYIQLTNFSIGYNEYLYEFITYTAFVSIILVVYAMFKYNIFEINITKNKVNFQNQVNTAHVGLNVFSHSIKNQLIAVKLLSEQLGYVEDKERKTKIVEEIVSICDNSIEKLSLSSQKMGIVKLKYEQININDLMTDKTNRDKKLYHTVKINLDSKSEISLKIDKTQFEKVIDNMVINAVEACKACTQPEISITIDKKDNFGLISISDNGSGIEEKNIKKIFEPFFSTKPMSSNWGVGLSFCKKIIEAFGGVILVTSKAKAGTEMTIYIPLYRR